VINIQGDPNVPQADNAAASMLRNRPINGGPFSQPAPTQAPTDYNALANKKLAAAGWGAPPSESMASAQQFGPAAVSDFAARNAAPAAAPAPAAPFPDRIAGSATGAPSAPAQPGAALARGVTRANFGANGPQGVYAARMKDGSIGFTDDPNSLNNFGAGVDARGLRRSDTQVNNFSNAGAYNGTPQQDTHVYGPDDAAPTSFPQQQNGMPQATGVNAAESNGLYRSLTGGGAPNANRAYAPNAIEAAGEDTSAASLGAMNPYELKNLQQRILAQGGKGGQEQAASNQALLQRVNARQQELAHGTNYGAAPTFGMGGAGGSLGAIKTIAGIENANRKTDIEANNSNSQAEQRVAGLHRQQLIDLENRVDHAGTPEDRANALLGALPTGMDDPATAGYLQSQIDSDIGGVSGSSWWNPTASAGGSKYGAGVRNLAFDKGPNDFTIGRPGAWGDVDAKGVFGGARLPSPYYSTSSIKSLKRFHDKLAAQDPQFAQ
jgi:hypothetical protein